MESIQSLEQQFSRQGFALVANVITEETLRQLRNLEVFSDAVSGGARAGQRSFEAAPAIETLLKRDGALTKIAIELLGPCARPVRLLFFNKTTGRNWAVPWHQDRTIAVKQRKSVAGFGPWSIKQGVNHVEPPSALLADMTCLRLHLDDCGADNGPLNVIEGSYLMGRIAAPDIASVVSQGRKIELSARPGDVIVMRGLTVHASSPSLNPSNRRVIHLDYCAQGLPGGLDWAMSVT